MLDFPSPAAIGQTFQGLYWDGVKWSGTTQQNIAPAYNNAGRNLLHNPLFNVAQRGAGPFSVSSVPAYTLDRWFAATTTVTDTGSWSQSPLPDTARTQIGDEAAQVCLNSTFTGNNVAGGGILLEQRLEGVRRLSGKTVTVSFWAACAAGTLQIGVSFDQNFGTGGSPSAGVSTNGTAVTINTTWARYSVTAAIPSAAGKTFGTTANDYLQLDLWYSAGSNFAARSGGIPVQSGTINLWGVQLEIGSVATPLEKPDPQQDLAKCQRFYQVGKVKLGGPGTAGVGNSYSYALPVVMRAIPTVVLGTPAGNVNAGTPAIAASAFSIDLNTTPTATSAMLYDNTFTASADL